MNIKNNFNFWKKFSKYLLVGLSAIVLLSGVQYGLLGDFTQRGPNTVLAEEDDCWDPFNYGCPEFGGVGEEYPTPVEPVAPVPVAPVVPVAPAPSCSDDHTYCDTNVNQTIHKTGGYWNGSECVYAFVPVGVCNQPAPQPTPPPGPSCTPNDQISTVQDCVGDQWCTFNIWRGTDCSTGRGGAYGCQQIPGRCGFAQPTPIPTPVPTPTPICNSNTTQENSCVNQQLCTFNTTRSCSGQVTSRIGPFNCRFIQGQCGYNPGPSCSASSTQQQRCLRQQLCTYTLTTHANCSRTESGPSNCFNSTQCGFTQPTPPPAPPAGGNQDVTVNPGPITVTNPTTVTSPPINITNNNPTHVTVNNPAPAAQQPARTFRQVSAASAPRVVTAQVQGVQTKELPKTGLPVAAWAALAFIPAGFRMRKIAGIKKDAEGNPVYLWEKRQFGKV